MRRFITLTRAPIGDYATASARTWIRPVALEPDAIPSRLPQLLEAIFKYAQNDFQPRPAPSLSCGDFIVLDDNEVRREVFRVEVCGFEPVGLDALTQAERLVMRFATTDLTEALGHQYAEAERIVGRSGQDEPAAENWRYSVVQNGY